MCNPDWCHGHEGDPVVPHLQPPTPKHLPSNSWCCIQGYPILQHSHLCGSPNPSVYLLAPNFVELCPMPPYPVASYPTPPRRLHIHFLAMFCPTCRALVLDPAIQPHCTLYHLPWMQANPNQTPNHLTLHQSLVARSLWTTTIKSESSSSPADSTLSWYSRPCLPIVTCTAYSFPHSPTRFAIHCGKKRCRDWNVGPGHLYRVTKHSLTEWRHALLQWRPTRYPPRVKTRAYGLKKHPYEVNTLTVKTPLKVKTYTLREWRHPYSMKIPTLRVKTHTLPSEDNLIMKIHTLYSEDPLIMMTHTW